MKKVLFCLFLLRYFSFSVLMNDHLFLLSCPFYVNSVFSLTCVKHLELCVCLTAAKQIQVIITAAVVSLCVQDLDGQVVLLYNESSFEDC